MNLNIYSYQNYRSYLVDMVKAHKSTRGYSTRLAESAGCRTSYLSQVLKLKVHLTPEHSVGLGEFWNFDKYESEYFLLLTLLGRTDLSSLKKVYSQRLARIREEKANLFERFSKTELELYHQKIYYSSWIYSAIHILLSLRDGWEVGSISQRLMIPGSVVKDCLNKLEAMGLIKKKGKTWEITQGSIHLSKDSPLNAINHQNWRAKACLDSMSDADGIHYTSIQTLGHKDYLELKDQIFSFLDQCRDKIEPSEPEELVCMNLDWFRV